MRSSLRLQAQQRAFPRVQSCHPALIFCRQIFSLQIDPGECSVYVWLWLWSSVIFSVAGFGMLRVEPLMLVATCRFAADVHRFRAAAFDGAVRAGHDGWFAANDARRFDVRALSRSVMSAAAPRTICDAHDRFALSWPQALPADPLEVYPPDLGDRPVGLRLDF